MVAWWTRTDVVTRWNPDDVKFSFASYSRHVVTNTIQRTTMPQLYTLSKIFYHTSFYRPTASGANVDPTSEVSSSAMLVLIIAGNKKVLFYGRPPWKTSIQNWIQIRPRIQELNFTDRQTDRVATICAFISCKESVKTCYHRITAGQEEQSEYCNMYTGYCNSSATNSFTFRHQNYRWLPSRCL